MFFLKKKANATQKMGPCPGIEPGESGANSAALPPRPPPRVPECADSRGLGDSNSTGKRPAVEKDQPVNAEVPARGASNTTTS